MGFAVGVGVHNWLGQPEDLSSFRDGVARTVIQHVPIVSIVVPFWGYLLGSLI